MVPDTTPQIQIPAFDDTETPVRKRRSFKGVNAFGSVPDPTLIEEASTYEETDFGFGLRIALHYQEHLMYVPGEGGKGVWLFYENGYWKEEGGQAQAETYARVVAETTGRQELEFLLAGNPEYCAALTALNQAEAFGAEKAIAVAEDEIEKVKASLLKERLSWTKAIKNGDVHIKAALGAAKSVLAVDAKDLDAHTDKINTPAGLLDLRTLKVEAPRPDHWCTRITSVSYVEGATHPDVETVFAWQDQVIPGMAEFTKRYLGMGLTTRHAKCFLYVDGLRNSGKSTIFEAAVNALGDTNGPGYGRIVEPVIFTGKGSSGEKPSPLLHTLRGVRFAFGDEADRVGFLNSNVVKRIVAGGTMVTRTLGHGAVAWPSQVTLTFAGNGIMPMADDDDGMRERIRTAKMNRTLPEEMKDEGLINRMLERPQQEALFAAMALGAQAWLQAGATRAALEIPAAVIEATDEHLTVADPLTDWLREVVDIVDPDDPSYLPLPLSAWSKLYNVWAKDANSVPLKMKHFKERLNGHGFVERDTARVVDGYKAKGVLRMGMKLRGVSPAELHARGLVKIDAPDAAFTPLHLVAVETAA